MSGDRASEFAAWGHAEVAGINAVVNQASNSAEAER